MTFPRKTEGGLLPKRAEDGGGHAFLHHSQNSVQCLGIHPYLYIYVNIYLFIYMSLTASQPFSGCNLHLRSR